MTDEEKASDIYEICLDRKSLCCIRKSGEDTCDKCKTYQMFKIGLEAGKPKWHNPWKDQNDLPKERGIYLILQEDKAGFSHYCVRDFRNGHFECTNTIIAWCEIPRFEGKAE